MRNHVRRINNLRMPKATFQERIESERRKGRPRKRWEQDVEEDLTRTGVGNYRQKVEDRLEW